MNNHCVPDWSIEDVSRSLLLPSENQKSMLADNKIIELLWKDGHVVMHSQTHGKPPATFNEFKQTQKPEPSMKCGDSLGSPGNLLQEDETASWFLYPLDESLEKEFCSEFFCETTEGTSARINNGIQASGVKLGATGESSVLTGSASNPCSNKEPPRLGNEVQQVQCLVDGGYTFSNDATGASARSLKEGVPTRSPREGLQTNTYKTTVTSSSGGSGCSFGRTEQKNAGKLSYKRKGRDGEESECPSEEAEYESKETNKPTHRSVSARRSRAAEVHNLSERKRRDRINEKMRALQELIPHCNKSDKASMLDEAIQYLKSLQLQVQIMWTGSGVSPMMFPGVQRYMSCMGMGMHHAPMSSPHNPIQLPRAPLVSQSMPSAHTANHTPMCPPPCLSPVSFPTQLQTVHLPDPYARHLGFHHMQPSQATNLYTYGSQGVEQNQPSQATAIGTNLPTVGITPEKIQNGHSG